MKINRIIGVYEVIGSVLGLYTVVEILSTHLEVKNVPFYFVTLLIMYTVIGISGVILVTYSELLKKHLFVAILAQSLQIFNFSAFGIEYTFQAGAILGCKIDQDFKFVFNLFEIVFELSTVSEDRFILVNGIPLIIIYSILNFNSTRQKNLQ